MYTHTNLQEVSRLIDEALNLRLHLDAPVQDTSLQPPPQITPLGNLTAPDKLQQDQHQLLLSSIQSTHQKNDTASHNKAMALMFDQASIDSRLHLHESILRQLHLAEEDLDFELDELELLPDPREELRLTRLEDIRAKQDICELQLKQLLAEQNALDILRTSYQVSANTTCTDLRPCPTPPHMGGATEPVDNHTCSAPTHSTTTHSKGCFTTCLPTPPKAQVLLPSPLPPN